MAEQLFIAVENLFSVAMFPGHTVSAEEEPSGYEAHQVANGRRASQYRWQASTADSESYIQVRCDEVRGANCLILDRGHNLATEQIILRGSNDNWATYRDVLTITLPSVVGGSFSGALGCVTTEGAWIKTFDAEAYYDWRLVISAMGSGLVPQIVGLWLGMAWMPTAKTSYLPVDDQNYAVTFTDSISPFTWAGQSERASPREGVLRLRHHENDGYDDVVQWQVRDLWARRGFAAWICQLRTDAPENAFLARVPAGTIRYDSNFPQWSGGRTLDVPFIEDQVSVTV